MFKIIDNIFFKPGRDRAWAEQRRAEAEQKRIAALRRIPTSSTNQLKGLRIQRQIKFISVSDHKIKDEAELDFLQRVVDAGGSGAINVSFRYHKGGYISVQGDAVVIV
jgi:hypothetical protein